MTELRASLPPLPERMRFLPVDERGYPVPYFVAMIDGKPDHRIVNPTAFKTCVQRELCWLCGDRLGVYRSFCIGPMCCVNRVSSEPPQHLACSMFAAQACPFLSRPMAKRREANLPAHKELPGGIMLERNPGVVAVWTSRRVTPFRSAHGGRDGILFELGEPVSLSFWTEGRSATRAEVDAAIEGGIPALLEAAPLKSERDRADFDADVARFVALLDKVLPL